LAKGPIDVFGIGSEQVGIVVVELSVGARLGPPAGRRTHVDLVFSIDHSHESLLSGVDGTTTP
jgi:hypothetical protein